MFLIYIINIDNNELLYAYFGHPYSEEQEGDNDKLINYH